MSKIILRASAKKNPQVASYLNAMKKGQKNIHVIFSSDSKTWKIKKAGIKKAIKICETQKDAIAYAKPKAKKQQAELFIHGKNGRIRERNTYGRDPFPPRG